MKKIVLILLIIICLIGFAKTRVLSFLLLIGAFVRWYESDFKILPNGHPILSRTLKIFFVLLIAFAIALFQTRIIVPNDFTGKYCLDDWEVPFFKRYYEKKLLAKLKKDFNVDFKLPINPEYNKTYTEMYRDNYLRFYLKTLVSPNKEFYSWTLGETIKENQDAYLVYYDLKSKKIYGTIYAYIFKENLEKDFMNRLQEAGVTLESTIRFKGRFLNYYEIDGKMLYENFVSFKEPAVIVFLDLYSDSSYDTIDKYEFPRIKEILKSEKFSGFGVRLTFYRKGYKYPYFDYHHNRL